MPTDTHRNFLYLDLRYSGRAIHLGVEWVLEAFISGSGAGYRLDVDGAAGRDQHLAQDRAIFCMGYGPQSWSTPRRPIVEISVERLEWFLRFGICSGHAQGSRSVS